MATNDKDISEKRLEDYPDVFADIANGLLFHGENRIKPEDLTAATPRTIYKADGKIHEQERDTAKMWKNGVICIAVLGLENQTSIDSDMPLRVIGYDGASYRNQLNGVDASAKKRYPVATLVLYFGYERKWEKPTRLKECFDIPDGLEDFVSDYKINVFNIAWLSDEEISRFQSDFRTVAEYFQQKRLNKNFNPSRDQVDHAYGMLDFLKAVSGSREFAEEHVNQFKPERSKVNMTSFFEDMKRLGEIDGEKKEQKRRILKALSMKKLSLEDIAEMFETSIENVKEIGKSNGIVMPS